MAESLPPSSPFETLSRRRSVAIWTALLTLVVLEAFVIGLPPVYRASATLLVESRMPEVLAGTGNPAETGTRLQTIKHVALSRARLTELLERFDLYGVSEGRASQEYALQRLQRDIRVDPTSEQVANGNTRTIAFRVSYVASDGEVAADVTNALASFFVAQNDLMRTAQVSRATEILGAELAETRQALESQEARVRTYSARNLGALPQQIEANLAAIARLDGQLRLNGAEHLRSSSAGRA